MSFTNVSVTSSSSQINFQPLLSWTRIPDSSGFDAGGSHMLTTDPNASATISYNFSSFYFLSARWPYQVACRITTGNTTSLVDLQDHTVPDLGIDSSAGATVKSSVVFKGGTGVYGLQTVTISLPRGYQLAVVDTLVFETVVDSGARGNPASVGVSTAEPTTTSSATKPSGQLSSSSKNVAPWIVLAIGIVFLLIAFGTAILVWKSKRRNPVKNRETIDPTFVSTDTNTLETALSTTDFSRVSTREFSRVSTREFSRLDASERGSMTDNSFQEHRHYHSPSVSISESSLHPRNRIPVVPAMPPTVTNAQDSMLRSAVVVAPSIPSQSQSQAEGSRRYHVANRHDEHELTSPSPPSYSFAVGNVLGRELDKKHPS